MTARFATTLNLALLAAGCQIGPLPDVPLADGRTLGELASRPGWHVILLLDPQECLQCLSSLSLWVEARQRVPEFPVHFVLSRRATSSEIVQLRLHRVHYDGEVAGRIPIDGRSGLHAVVIEDGMVVATRDVRGMGPSDSVLAVVRRAAGLLQDD